MNTPGPGGYVVIHLLSAVLLWLPVTVASVLSPGGGVDTAVPEAVLIPIVAGLVTVFLGVPGAILGIALLHPLLRQVTEQWVHVVAFALVGAAVGTAYSLVFFQEQTWWWWGLAASTGVARAVLIPSVRRSRR